VYRCCSWAGKNKARPGKTRQDGRRGHGKAVGGKGKRRVVRRVRLTVIVCRCRALRFAGSSRARSHGRERSCDSRLGAAAGTLQTNGSGLAVIGRRRFELSLLFLGFSRRPQAR
jgi:hypothetical protein